MRVTQWVNVTSVGGEVTLEVLRELERGAAGVEVYDSSQRCGAPEATIGKTLRYQLRGVDLWAEVEFFPCAVNSNAMGKWTPVGVVVFKDGKWVLAGVLLTKLSRHLIKSAAAGLDFEVAQAIEGKTPGDA